MKDYILDVENLFVEYGTTHILRGISIGFESGRSYAIIGESGAGKTTLLRAIDGLLPRSAKVSGDILLYNRKISSYKDIRGRIISYLMQDPRNQFNPTFTIGRQVERAIGLSGKKIKKDDKKKAALDAMKDAGLDDKTYNLYPHQMSGGMLQRANIAIALVEKAPIILLDEPTSGLDIGLQQMIINRLLEENKNRNATLIFITHSIQSARKADYTIAMENGMVVEQERSERLFGSPSSEYVKALIKASNYD